MHRIVVTLGLFVLGAILALAPGTVLADNYPVYPRPVPLPVQPGVLVPDQYSHRPGAGQTRPGRGAHGEGVMARLQGSTDTVDVFVGGVRAA